MSVGDITFLGFAALVVAGFLATGVTAFTPWRLFPVTEVKTGRIVFVCWAAAAALVAWMLFTGPPSGRLPKAPWIGPTVNVVGSLIFGLPVGLLLTVIVRVFTRDPKPKARTPASTGEGTPGEHRRE